MTDHMSMNPSDKKVRRSSEVFVALCALIALALLPSPNLPHAAIYKWVDEDGKVHFSDRKDHRVEQEVVNVKPSASNWSRYEIDIRAEGVELEDEEREAIVDGVNNVYEFFDRVMFFDIYKTVPVNILILKDRAAYKDYLISKNRGFAVASYGMFIPSEHQIVVYVQKDRERTFRTIKHEVSHAVVDTIVPYAPAWLHEGFAEQMEMLKRDSTGLYFEPHRENHWVVAQAHDNGGLANIEQMLKMQSSQWKHTDLSGRGNLRSQSSQFVNFLLSNPTRRQFVVRLMHNFNRGDRTLSYYLVNDNYIGGVEALKLEWSRWVRQEGDSVVRL